jgi:ectoine hydroxylase-related dioxygenase (phytanoyl-CoA dioxygenase family)
MHQFKINAKAAFTGEVWQWHQDYGTWLRDDGMPEPRAMNIAVFLDEVMAGQRAADADPRSQNRGNLQAAHDTSTTSYPLWTLDEKVVTELVQEGGIVAPTGKAGGLLMFHGNLVHGSAPNITPYPRRIVYLTLNAVSNHIRKPTRPDGSRTPTSRRSSRCRTTRCCSMRGGTSRRRSRVYRLRSTPTGRVASRAISPPANRAGSARYASAIGSASTPQNSSAPILSVGTRTRPAAIASSVAMAPPFFAPREATSDS